MPLNEFEFFVFYATFSNNSAISWRLVLVVEEAGVFYMPLKVIIYWHCFTYKFLFNYMDYICILFRFDLIFGV